MKSKSQISKERRQILRDVGLNPDDVTRWNKKLIDKRHGVKIMPDVECLLTFEEYIKIVVESGLSSPDQIGLSLHMYSLSRYGDVGNYEYGNCRYILTKQNLQERIENGGSKKGSKRLAEWNTRTKTGKPNPKGSIAKSKPFILISPEGEKFEGENLLHFCKENNLEYPALANVVSGKTLKTKKGWMGYR